MYMWNKTWIKFSFPARFDYIVASRGPAALPRTNEPVNRVVVVSHRKVFRQPQINVANNIIRDHEMKRVARKPLS